MPTDPSLAMPVKAPVLTLYWREYCHLCHDMLAQLLALRQEMSEAQGGAQIFSVSQVDVDDDPHLEARYDEWVPVLMAGERELCHYFLKPEVVRAYLAEIR